MFLVPQIPLIQLDAPMVFKSPCASFFPPVNIIHRNSDRLGFLEERTLCLPRFPLLTSSFFFSLRRSFFFNLCIHPLGVFFKIEGSSCRIANSLLLSLDPTVNS